VQNFKTTVQNDDQVDLQRLFCNIHSIYWF